MRTRLGLAVLALAGTSLAFPADTGKALLDAARNGNAAAVRSLIGSGAALEATDKDGKTPLMAAAEAGRAEIVHLLLERGADAGARDKEGLSAYGLALLSSPGKREAVLAELPKPPVIRLSVEAAWLPDNMTSSCFLSREDLAKTLGMLHIDAYLLGAFANLARVNSRDAVDIVRAEAEGLKPDAASMAGPAADADAAVSLAIRPGVTCLRGADDLSLQIDVRVTRAGNGTPVYQKAFGGGLKGLHTPPVDNPSQYKLYFEKWTNGHAGPIYWGVLRALLRK